MQYYINWWFKMLWLSSIAKIFLCILKMYWMPSTWKSCSKKNYCTICQTGYIPNNLTKSCDKCQVLGRSTCPESRSVCLNWHKGLLFALKTNRCKECHNSCATSVGPKQKTFWSCKLDKEIRMIEYIDPTGELEDHSRIKLLTQFLQLRFMRTMLIFLSSLDSTIRGEWMPLTWYDRIRRYSKSG